MSLSADLTVYENLLILRRLLDAAKSKPFKSPEGTALDGALSRFPSLYEDKAKWSNGGASEVPRVLIRGIIQDLVNYYTRRFAPPSWRAQFPADEDAKEEKEGKASDVLLSSNDEQQRRRGGLALSAEDRAVTANLLCALRCLMREDNCDEQEDIVEKCINLVAMDLADYGIQYQGASVINNLCYRADPNRELICKHKGERVMIEAIHTLFNHPSAATYQELACSVLRSLAYSDPCRLRLLRWKKPLIELTLKTTERTMENQELVTAAIGALCNVCAISETANPDLAPFTAEASPTEHLVQQRGIPLVLKALEKYPDDWHLADLACLLFWHVSRAASTRETLVKHGVLEKLLKILDSVDGNPEMIHNALGTLASLSVHRDIASRLISAGVIPRIISILKSYRSSSAPSLPPSEGLSVPEQQRERKQQVQQKLQQQQQQQKPAEGKEGKDEKDEKQQQRQPPQKGFSEQVILAGGLREIARTFRRHIASAIITRACCIALSHHTSTVQYREAQVHYGVLELLFTEIARYNGLEVPEAVRRYRPPLPASLFAGLDDPLAAATAIVADSDEEERGREGRDDLPPLVPMLDEQEEEEEGADQGSSGGSVEPRVVYVELGLGKRRRAEIEQELRQQEQQQQQQQKAEEKDEEMTPVPENSSEKATTGTGEKNSSDSAGAASSSSSSSSSADSLEARLREKEERQRREEEAEAYELAWYCLSALVNGERMAQHVAKAGGVDFILACLRGVAPEAVLEKVDALTEMHRSGAQQQQQAAAERKTPEEKDAADKTVAAAAQQQQQRSSGGSSNNKRKQLSPALREHVAHWGLRILSQLAVARHEAERITSKGGLHLAIEMLRLFPESPAVADGMGYAVFNLLTPESRDRLIPDESVSDDIVASMRRHLNSPNVQEQLAGVLYKIARSRDPDHDVLTLRVIRSGAIDALVAAMRKHPDHMGVIEWCYTALCSICSNLAAAQELIEMGGHTETLERLMKKRDATISADEAKIYTKAIDSCKRFLACIKSQSRPGWEPDKIEPLTLASYRRRQPWRDIESEVYATLCEGALGQLFPEMNKELTSLIADYAAPFWGRGDRCDAKDSRDRRWYPATIIYTRALPNSRSPLGLREMGLFMYDGRSSLFAEWIHLADTERIAPLGTKSRRRRGPLPLPLDDDDDIDP